MTATDAIFWYAETALPRFRPVIGGLFELDGAPATGALEAVFARAIAAIPRLRQRVAEAPLHVAPPEWIDDPHFDPGYHLRRVALPAPGHWRELLDLAGTLLAAPLDRERPLWEATVLEGLDGGRAALMMKLHHSVVDGVGALALLQALTQPHGERLARARSHPRSAPAGFPTRVGALAADASARALALTDRALRASVRAAADPRAAAREGWRAARGIARTLVDFTAGTVHDPLAEGGSGLSRRLETIEVPLERVEQTATRLGATLNDLLLAVLAGTQGAYHRERGVSVRALRCLVPMNLRSGDERHQLGNRLGLFNVWLPVAERDRGRRLRAIERQTRAAKRDRRGDAAKFLVDAAMLLPGPAFRWLARQSLGRVNTVCTNIHGPREICHLAGRRVRALFPFAPVVEGTPLVIAALSYAGKLAIGIDTDQECIPDPERIRALLEAELAGYAAFASGRSAPKARAR
jgi:diacylglycerol O-acyltransferase